MIVSCSRLAHLWLFLVSVTLTASCQKESRPTGTYSIEEAQKVLTAIAAVESATEQPWTGPRRSVTLSESELNSYIAYRIETEEEEIMRELRLKLLGKNEIEGKIHIDLRGQDVPRYIRPEMDVYFAADLLTENGRVKIDIKELFVGDEPIQPFILDLVMAISARLRNEPATSLSDWYELPYGIKEIKTEKGKATFYY
jgi:hypothetical protein